MTFSVTFKLDTSKLDRIVSNLEPGSVELVDEYTGLMLDKMQQDVPVDTGALRDSLEREMEGATAILHDGVEYGVYQELGTSKMAAQPFFFSAVEAYMNPFFQSFSRLFR